MVARRQAARVEGDGGHDPDCPVPAARRRTARALAVALALAGAGCGPAPLVPNGIAQLELRDDAPALRRVANDEEAAGTLERRRATIADLNRQLLMPPPRDALVPELFDLVVAMAPQMESQNVSPAWASYVYTSYQRDLVRERPDGTPRRSLQEVQAALDAYVEYFRLRARPDGSGFDPAAAGMQDTIEWRNERRLGR
jgi:hypothetical protein